MRIMHREAVIDPTGSYRYSLIREWVSTKPRVIWIMLNPSTADSQEDDPTIDACIRFTKKWGFGSFEVVNLFAYRSKDPDDLEEVDKSTAIGTENLKYISEALERSDLIVTAWGENGKIHKRNQDDELISLFSNYQLKCLDILKGGEPRHPLYFCTENTLKDYELRKIITVKPTVTRKFTSREGMLIDKDGKEFYDDTWMFSEEDLL